MLEPKMYTKLTAATATATANAANIKTSQSEIEEMQRAPLCSELWSVSVTD